MILFIQGQEPLTVSMLFEAPTAERKEILGEHLYILIKAMLYPDPELIGKITGMLLEMDNIDLLHLTQHQGSLKSKVQEAVKVLELVVPMSVIGLVSDVNTCFLEKLSIVVDNLVANSITQKDILESFNNYDTAKDIQDKVLKSIVPEMVANGFCHVSRNKLSM